MFSYALTFVIGLISGGICGVFAAAMAKSAGTELITAEQQANKSL